MKKFILCIFIFILSSPLIAQMYIITNKTLYSCFNEEKNDWEVISPQINEITFFEFDNNLTTIKHHIDLGINNYSIESKKEVKELKLFEFEITSNDIEKKYLMKIDFSNNTLSFIFECFGETCVTQYNIKKILFDKD